MQTWQIPTARQPNVGPGRAELFGPLFWLALVEASVAAGLAAGLLMRLLKAVETLAWGPGTGDFLDAIQRNSARHRLLVVSAAGVVVVLTRLLLRLRGSGHGGELAAAIWFRAGRLPVLRTLLNAVASIVIVAMGASLGREAAPKQTGALFFGLFAGWAALPPAQRRLLAACGAGAGMAAVYNVPLGGALFSIEVLLGSLSLGLMAPALVSSLIATACAWLLLPNQPTYTVPYYGVSPALLLWSALAGPPLGLCAVLLVRLIGWADAAKPQGWALFLAPLLVFPALGAVAIALPQLLGNGKDAVQLAYTGGLPLATAVALAAAKPLATAACLGSGAPGGLFTPTLTVGAVLGLALGEAFARAWTGSFLPIGACAIVGSGAVLAASTQGPVSAIVLVMELTRRVDPILVPLMLAISGAVLVARRFETRSVYSGRIRVARDRAEAAPGATVSAAARLPELLLALLPHPGARLRVLDQDGETLGELGRAQVLAASRSIDPAEIATARDCLSES